MLYRNKEELHVSHSTELQGTWYWMNKQCRRSPLVSEFACNVTPIKVSWYLSHFSIFYFSHSFISAHVLVRVSITAQTSWPKSTWGGKGLSSLLFHIAVHHQRKSGLEFKQVRKQELMQKPWRDALYWLASPGLLSLLSYRSQDYQPRDGTTHNGPSSLDN